MLVQHTALRFEAVILPALYINQSLFDAWPLVASSSLRTCVVLSTYCVYKAMSFKRIDIYLQ